MRTQIVAMISKSVPARIAYRIEVLSNLARSLSERISALAILVGYADPENLHRTLRCETGQTARDFRARLDSCVISINL
jgi:AraC-like DNA-binding protein